MYILMYISINRSPATPRQKSTISTSTSHLYNRFRWVAHTHDLARPEKRMACGRQAWMLQKYHGTHAMPVPWDKIVYGIYRTDAIRPYSFSCRAVQLFIRWITQVRRSFCNASSRIHESRGPDILSGCLDPVAQLIHVLAPLAQSLAHAGDLRHVQHTRLHPREVDKLVHLVDGALD